MGGERHRWHFEGVWEENGNCRKRNRKPVSEKTTEWRFRKQPTQDRRAAERERKNQASITHISPSTSAPVENPPNSQLHTIPWEFNSLHSALKICWILLTGKKRREEEILLKQTGVDKKTGYLCGFITLWLAYFKYDAKETEAKCHTGPVRKHHNNIKKSLGFMLVCKKRPSRKDKERILLWNFI